MYKDIITYDLAPGVTKEHLLATVEKVIEGWMKKQSGFIKMEVHTNSDDTYTDIVYWDSQESAKKAELEMGNIPNGGEWFACYKEGSISSKNVTQISDFK